ncbi:Uncharacterized protein OS=Pirellula staleyi (strain ATCC 27377 / DSM 6068 / ICPB 4128) GN=Psta_3409 PE=4 SV=1 [Gemmataceae bacterium]|nr:Uncharacterized protein OS=Pirellula staleyi (strain ATCC 27377 / DSM 6068 / ICPB 4128) GN=Psta_3409 PE=4 SV=1 [Gemmataceae bacterium]VTU00880.1 Uncharacterized protein OS=Pirellula staleyi (strain ATCC 27377 / DSM 6068 / ICPB 4128) GN=Psta_3409 PE=4 SV=1 [Gemmataceae bacterium]
MILFTRAVARDVRAVLARCASGRPRGPAPTVVVRACGGQRTVTATTPGGVMVVHTTPAPDAPDGVAVVPAAVLADVEGAADTAVVLDRASKGRGTVRWEAGGAAHARPVELILPGTQHDAPVVPELTPVADRLLVALDACGRAAARDDGRYALSRVQLRGRAGTVVGTDGKIAVLFNALAFPFADDVLVPAVPVFASKPLARAGVRVGRAPAHMVVAAGPWAVFLPVTTGARYPDVAAVIPRHAATTVTLDPADAEAVLAALPGLPGAADEHRPVTLDAGPTVAVRGLDAGTGAVRAVVLERSAAAGPPVRMALDRRLLARALALGCRVLKVSTDRTLVAEGDGVTAVVAALDPDLAVPPAGDAGSAAAVNTERSALMKTTDVPGPAALRGDPQDPLVAAEELRDALADAAAKAARLVAALRAGRKEKKVLASVYAGLKQLNLGAPDGKP